MPAEEPENNPYELLGITFGATEAEIKKAYRQRSLKVHPDRNPNNPDAARKFHELNQAHELLLDPLRRLALDQSVKAKEARKARFAKFDAKRKGLQEELEEAERRASKKYKADKVKEERQRQEETERIKEEGRKMREEKVQEMLRKQREAEQETDEPEHVDEPPEPGSLDTTIKLKFPAADYPNLTTSSALSSLLSQFGESDESSIVLSLKPSKKTPGKPAKYGTGLVPMRRIGDAFAAVCASGRADLNLKGIDISWAEGKEPAIVKWLKDNGKLGPAAKLEPNKASPTPTPSIPPVEWTSTSTTPNTSQFSTFPTAFSFPSEPKLPDTKAPSTAGLDFESLTLMRLREAERKRLEREILEQEAAEG